MLRNSRFLNISYLQIINFSLLCSQDKRNQNGSEFRMWLVANAAPSCVCVSMAGTDSDWESFLVRTTRLNGGNRPELSHRKSSEKRSRTPSARPDILWARRRPSPTLRHLLYINAPPQWPGTHTHTHTSPLSRTWS